jgi:uncharacterized membrane protein YtjA (UPF0391 family)
MQTSNRFADCPRISSESSKNRPPAGRVGSFATTFCRFANLTRRSDQFRRFGTLVAIVQRRRSIFQLKIGQLSELPAPVYLEGTVMLYWAAVFFVIALIAAVFGFGGIAVGAAEIAKIIFFVFLVLFIVSLLFGGLRRGPMV